MSNYKDDKRKLEDWQKRLAYNSEINVHTHIFRAILEFGNVFSVMIGIITVLFLFKIGISWVFPLALLFSISPAFNIACWTYAKSDQKISYPDFYSKLFLYSLVISTLAAFVFGFMGGLVANYLG